MSLIDKKYVESLFRKEIDCKTNHGKDNEELFDYCKFTLENYFSYLSTLGSYEMGQITNGIDHFLDDKKKTPDNTFYKRGTIVLIDFGFTNFGYEFSYPHPAIVIRQTKFHVYLAPCSSKKFGRNLPDVLDGYISDGFQENTGIILDGLRYCSKSRIISIMGYVNERILREVDNYQLKVIPTYKEIILKKDKEIEKMEEEIIELRRIITKLKKHL